MLLKSAPAPMAVFSSAELAKERPSANSRIQLAIGVAQERQANQLPCCMMPLVRLKRAFCSFCSVASRDSRRPVVERLPAVLAKTQGTSTQAQAIPMFSDLPCGSYIHFFFVFIPLTKEKNAERFKKSEHFLPAATADCSDVGKTRQLVEAIRRKRRSPIRVPQNPSTFHPPAQRNAFRRRDVRQRSTIVRPLKLIAETQPQLQPALLRLSAMISQRCSEKCFRVKPWR